MTLPVSGRGLRLAGWLLTPAVVWAASFAGGWLGARLGGPESGIVWLVGGSVVGGTAGLVVWMLRLVRGARLARKQTPDQGAER